ncbi:hypothetical protein DRN80_06425, partial [Methanosarcinales archaeon]
NLLAQLDVYLLPVAKIREIDPDLETFTNINTPAELELHHDHYHDHALQTYHRSKPVKSD